MGGRNQVSSTDSVQWEDATRSEQWILGSVVGSGQCSGHWTVQWALDSAVGTGQCSGHWAVQWALGSAVASVAALMGEGVTATLCAEDKCLGELLSAVFTDLFT